MIRDDLTYRWDVAAFAKRLDFEPDPNQARVLDPGIHRGMLNCTRQWGKSTVMSIKALHHAFVNAESLVLVLAPTEHQGAELVRKSAVLAGRLGLKARGDGINKDSILLPNGSRVVPLPHNETNIRGFSNTGLLLVDEAARVADELYETAYGFLAASDGDLWLLSTPRGRRGFFYREWFSRDEEWTRVAVPATECPRISKRFLDEQRRKLPDRTFRQEYQCEFIDDDSSLFPRDLIERSLRDSIEPLLPDVRW
jgi:hypothetical protein